MNKYTNKLWFKNVIKLLLHLWVLGTMGWILLSHSINIISNDNGAFKILIAWMSIFMYIALHGFIGWWLEKTPLRTKAIKEDIRAIEVDKTKQENRIKLENENQTSKEPKTIDKIVDDAVDKVMNKEEIKNEEK